MPHCGSRQRRCAAKEIVRRTGHGRNLVRQISRGGDADVFRTRQSTPGRASAVPGHAVVRRLSQRCRTLAPFKGTRLQGIAARGGGMGDATAACRDYQPSTIAEGPRRQDDSAADDDDARPPNQGRDRHACRHRTKFPMLADAQAFVGRFHAMIRRKAEMELQSWIDESKRSLIASFANGIANDKGRGARRYYATLVQWPSGSSDHQAQAGQTADVRAR
ncbi:hypothetical protein ACVWYQ_003577 [Bradyrhizobium sp. USDA 3397]